ncbi:unnamed protein product [Sphacelaria rigidula]
MVACKYPQVRKWETGRCKTPCRADQAINPDTGRCVTKTYLKALHIRGDLGTSDYRSALRDDGITRRDGRSRRSGGPVRRLTNQRRTNDDQFGLNKLGDFDYSDFEYKERAITPYRARKTRGYYGSDNERDLRDLLVADPDCYPRKLNLLTGRCKTPCPPGYAMSPKTQRCVTIEYLLSQDLDYYIEDGDDWMAESIKWYPSTVQTLANHTDADLKKLINESRLTVSDLKVMSGIESVMTGHAVMLVGNYRHGQRKACEESLVRSLVTSKVAQCGLRNVEHFTGSEDDGQLLVNHKIDNAGEDYTFVFSRKVFGSDVLRQILGMVYGRTITAKFAIIESHGVWRIICPRGLSFLPQVPTQDDMNAQGGRKKLAEELDKYFKNKISISYHPFDAQTRY